MPLCDGAAGALHYHVGGEGEPVLLLAGLGVDRSAWAFQTPALRPHGRVITLENRGSGGSVAPEGDYTIAAMAQDAVDLLDHLEVATASVVGASMGGMIAQVLAATYANRVNRLVLLTTAARPDADLLALLETVERIAREEGVVAAMQHSIQLCFTPRFLTDQAAMMEAILRGIAETPAVPLHGLLGQIAAVRACNTESLLPKIHIPTLVLAAEADEVFPVKHSEALAAGLPNAVLQVVPGGHGCTLESKDSLNRALVEFLTVD